MKIHKSILLVPLITWFGQSGAEDLQSAVTRGSVAPANLIYNSAGRGQVLDQDLPQEQSSPEVSKIQKPVTTSAMSAMLANTTQHPPSIEAPLARGRLSEQARSALTDNLVRNLSLGTIVLSASLDENGDTFARNHRDSSTVKTLTKAGDALPFVAIGAAALAALDTSDPRMSRTGISALQAGGASALSSFALKYITARARPEENLGHTSFHAPSTQKGDSSFPSIHTATLWGIVTPFAKEYDMPWLYGAALLTNFSRVAGRKHWVSDTVAGSLIGYWAGDIAWNHNKPKSENSAQIYLGERSINVVWPF